jgi:hypothetical protein
MIERRPFCDLLAEDFGWLKIRRHIAPGSQRDPARRVRNCLCVWNDGEIAPSAGFALHSHANIEIITYVCEGIVTHRDSLGNEGRIEAGCVQVLSAGDGIRHAEYNLEQVPARIFQIWIAPVTPGGSPAWGADHCPIPAQCGIFVPIASGFEDDWDALPIRANARVLNAKLKRGSSIQHSFLDTHFAYLVPSSGTIDINGVRICARDGAAISGMGHLKIDAIEDADLVMVDVAETAANHPTSN